MLVIFPLLRSRNTEGDFIPLLLISNFVLSGMLIGANCSSGVCVCVCVRLLRILPFYFTESPYRDDWLSDAKMVIDNLQFQSSYTWCIISLDMTWHGILFFIIIIISDFCWEFGLPTIDIEIIFDSWTMFRFARANFLYQINQSCLLQIFVMHGFVFFSYIFSLGILGNLNLHTSPDPWVLALQSVVVPTANAF